LGEVGVELEDVAHVAHDEEGRRVLLAGQGAGVAFGLAARLEHGVVPLGGAADGAGFAGGGFVAEGEFGLVGGLVVLLGFEDEAALFIEINAAGFSLPEEFYCAFEDVGIAFGVRAGRFRRGQVERGAKLGQEERIVGAFRAVLAFPAGDKTINVTLTHSARRLTVLADGSKRGRYRIRFGSVRSG
jgi:hypothetical protein